MTVPNFKTLLTTARLRNPGWVPPNCLLSLDPGETTGWALFVQGELQDCGQLDTKNGDVVASLYSMVHDLEPNVIVMEDYKVYGWKTKDHSWSALHTPKLIGAIQAICSMQHIELHLQMAQTAKNFCTNDKLRAWGMYSSSTRHAMDAIRHGCYWLLFSR